MRNASDCFELTCRLGVETGKAILIELPNPDMPGFFVSHWIPFSQVEAIHRNLTDADKSTLVMTKWIAGKKGFLGEEE